MFNAMIETLKANPRKIIFTEGHDARILEATDRLVKGGFLTPILIGNEKAIQAAAEEAGMSKPSAGQIQYIDLSGADSAVVYGDEPGVVEKAASSLKEGALSLWEYFS